MGNYMDRKYAAVDGVLLSYNGNDTALKLPARLADMDIHTIGAGAVMESQSLQQVVIPKSVRKIAGDAFNRCAHLVKAYVPYSVNTISDSAFRNCSDLTDLYIYGIELDEQRYRDLLASSRRGNGSNYLTHYFPDLKTVRQAVSASDARPASCVHDGIAKLFTSYNYTGERGMDSLQRKLDGFAFESEERHLTETEEFIRLIADDNNFVYDKRAEEINDASMKKDVPQKYEKTAVFTFDDSKTKHENGRHIVFADIRIGYHFWQSKVRVNLSGDTYYVYRRHYLSSVPESSYTRRDVAVFSETGLVTDRKAAEEVYAKYKLLSIL